MARIRLTPRQSYSFSFTLPVRITDLNMGGHVSNSRIAEMFHEGRYRALTEMGLSEGNLGDGATGLVLADMVMNFKAEAFGNDILTVETDFDEFSTYECRSFYRLKRGEDTIALGESGLVGFNFFERKKSPIPDEFKHLVGAEALCS